MVLELFLAAAASLLIVIPRWIETRSSRKHSQRLEDLRAGDPEHYFEEQRSIEAYPAKGRLAYRLLAAALLFYALARLTLGD